MGKKVFGLLLPLLVLAVLALLWVKNGVFALSEGTEGLTDGKITSACSDDMTEDGGKESVSLTLAPYLTVGTAPRTEACEEDLTPETESETTEAVSVMAGVTVGVSGMEADSATGGLVTEFCDAYIVTPEEEAKPDTLVTGFADTLPLTLPVASPNVATEEIEAVYVATVYGLDFPSATGLSSAKLKGELDSIVAGCVASSANTIFFQVRPASDAFYASAIFPSSRFLVGVEGGTMSFDPLAYLVKAAHKQGIAVHAWVNPFRVGDGTGLAADNPAARHPEWLLRVGGGLYYDPARAEVQALVVDGVCELVARYDIDGVLFDDYFYPSGISDEDLPSYYAYLTAGGGLSIGDFRRENVNRLVEAVYRAVKALDRECLFGVAPRGVWRNASEDPRGSATSGGSAYDEIYCDALAWVAGGYLDYLAPQLYWPLDSAVCPFAVLAGWWNDALMESGVKLVVSLAAYSMSDEEIGRQIEHLKPLDTYGGYALFRYGAK